MLELFSSQSMHTSLEAIRTGTAGLDAHKVALLNRVPSSGDWARFPAEHLDIKDLAYLTAKTGHEFAILRGKKEDILFHGNALKCVFDDVLVELLKNKHLMIYAHSHPGEETPVPSPQDRDTLKQIGQSSSNLISGRTGMIITFSADMFADFM